MNRARKFVAIGLFGLLLSGCMNVPQAPTKTPTMTNEELQMAVMHTMEAGMAMTQTQDAILNPSATPTPENTATPVETATPLKPVIPPTETPKPLPFYSVGDSKCLVKLIDGDGDPAKNSYVPFARLYLEVCYKNAGAAEWNQNFRTIITRNDGGSTNPNEGVLLGKSVKTGEWACFSFNQSMAGHDLGSHYSSFSLLNESGTAMANGYQNCYWNVH